MDYNKIDKDAVKAWFIGRIIFLIIFSIIYFLVIYKFFMPKYQHISIVKYGLNILSFIIIGFLIINTFIFPLVEYKQWRYKIYEDKIELINGIIIRDKIIIPISRIQHLDIEQGPIYRIFNLSCIKINTAGDSHVIPALSNDEAEEISERLKDVVEMGGKLE